MKKQITLTLADYSCDLRARKIKQEFFRHINTIIDWRPIKKIIDKYDERGNSATGNAAYDGLILFKMCLLQTWYNLSDYEVEDQVNDRISFGYFCNLSIDTVAPDHSTLSRFRTAMTKSGVFEKLFKNINKQLEKHNIIVKSGAMVDASVIDTPLKPKGKATYRVAEQIIPESISKSDSVSESISKSESTDNIPPVTLEREIPDSVDKEGAWLKKAGKLRYGYKKHVVTDNEGLILGVVTTAANVNEITNMEEVLVSADLPQNIPLKGDKGYRSKKNSKILEDLKLKDHILKKATKSKPLSRWEKRFNKLIGKTRYKVERTFGSIKRWFGGGCARYKGLAKMHTQNLIEGICYNLYRSPGLTMPNCQK